jgi:hypothetical protein
MFGSILRVPALILIGGVLRLLNSNTDQMVLLRPLTLISKISYSTNSKSSYPGWIYSFLIRHSFNIVPACGFSALA